MRLLDDAGGFNQSIVRPGIGLSLSENLAVGAGYGWIHTSPLVAGDFDEHRIWQQLTWSRGNEMWTFALRSRLEQRFLETGDDTGWRFRQLVRMHHHLPELPRLSFVVWDEMFFHLNDTDSRRVVAKRTIKIRRTVKAWAPACQTAQRLDQSPAA